MLLFVPIEAVGGIMANHLQGAINIIGYSYRGVIILYYSRKFFKKKYFAFAIFSMVLFFSVMYNYLDRQYSSIAFDFISFIRVMYFVTLCIGVADDVLSGKLNYKFIESILDVSAYFVIIVYLLSLVTGSGLTNYMESSSGYKAFFNSVNSLTLVLIILSGFQLYSFIIGRGIHHLILYIIISVNLLLIGSKSGIFFWGIYLLFSLTHRLSKKYISKVISLSLVLLFGVVVFASCFSSQIEAIIGRFMYFHDTSESNLQFLLSGRSTLLSCAYRVYSEEIGVFDVLFGKGVSNMQFLIGMESGWGIIKNIEMDFFDLFFSYGLVSIFVTYGLVIFLCRMRKSHSLNERKIMLLICIVFSILGGHVFLDSFGSTILSLVLGMYLCSNSKMEINNFRHIGLRETVSI